MKLQTKSLLILREACEVMPGNIYPAKGGKRPGTDYWLCIAVSGSTAHLIGFNEKGDPVSTSSYNTPSMRERPVIGRCDIGSISLSVKGPV